MMRVSKNIIVICEGASEWTYLQRLNAFLAGLPFPDGWYEVPVRFIGRPGRNGVGSGSFNAVKRELAVARKLNRSAMAWVWVDADLYVRNERACGDSYRGRSGGVPPFCFSLYNFEDFVALHLDDEGFERWARVMTEGGHFRSPLPWEAYKGLFASVLPEYRKGDLPADFITVESLGNLRRHLTQLPRMELNGLPVERTFAHAMLEELSRRYPELRA